MSGTTDRRGFLGAVAGVAAGAMVPIPQVKQLTILGVPLVYVDHLEGVPANLLAGIPYWRRPDGSLPQWPEGLSFDDYLAEVERRDRETEAWLRAESLDKTA